MAVPADRLSPTLTLIEGGRTIVQRRDEAHIEAIAFMEEVISSAARIVNAVAALPVPSTLVINEANRMAYRADFARAEMLALTTPRDAA